MDLVSLATRRFIEPLHVSMKRSTVLRQKRALLESQYLGEEEIRANQWRSVQQMIRYAYEHNAFYRERFAALGATPGDFRTPDDYAKLPLLTKDDLRSNSETLVSDGHDRGSLRRKRTGGSTGVPVHLFLTNEAAITKDAIRMRHDEWAHFRVGDKRAALWGDVKPAPTLRDWLFDAIFVRTIFLDTIKMDEESMLAFAEQIRRTRTRLLFGHGHSIYYFARFLSEHGVDDIRFDGIISTAEMLPPEERRVVEAVFGNVVFDRYGCEEVGLIASECAEHDGLHVAAEGIFLEILDGTAQEPGRVVLTDVLNRATPLLRYEIGDLATTKAGACRCGRGLPRIGKVTGRTSDVLYTPEGKQISGISLLDTVTIHIPGFRQVQVVQEVIDELAFNIVKDEASFSDTSLKLLAEAVRRYFGPSMKHRVVFVDKVQLTGRGKFQFSICKLKPEERPFAA